MITQEGCLLDYPYFKEQFKLIATDLSKEQALYANRKTIQQINFIEVWRGWKYKFNWWDLRVQ